MKKSKGDQILDKRATKALRNRNAARNKKLEEFRMMLRNTLETNQQRQFARFYASTFFRPEPRRTMAFSDGTIIDVDRFRETYNMIGGQELGYNYVMSPDVYLGDHTPSTPFFGPLYSNQYYRVVTYAPTVYAPINWDRNWVQRTLRPWVQQYRINEGNSRGRFTVEPYKFFIEKRGDGYYINPIREEGNFATLGSDFAQQMIQTQTQPNRDRRSVEFRTIRGVSAYPLLGDDDFASFVGTDPRAWDEAYARYRSAGIIDMSREEFQRVYGSVAGEHTLTSTSEGQLNRWRALEHERATTETLVYYNRNYQKSHFRVLPGDPEGDCVICFEKFGNRELLHCNHCPNKTHWRCAKRGEVEICPFCRESLRL